MTTAVTAVTLAEFIDQIDAPDPKWLKQARTHLDNLTKPLGSLGRLEDIAARLVAIRKGSPWLAAEQSCLCIRGRSRHRGRRSQCISPGSHSANGA